ncbi:MAG: M16 family metallopeptidase [Gammaproteobacteria bacterium]
MRINFMLFILLCFAPQTWARVNIEQWQTTQGARVYFVRAEALPMVDIQVVFDAGSARDGKQFGIAALTSGLLDSGAGEWNADAVAQRFDSIGAQFGAAAGIDNAEVSLRTLTQKPLFDKAIETVKTILAQPTFNEADFQREKARMLAALQQRQEQPAEIASIAFYKALYGDHPYGHPVDGFIDTVTPLTAQDVRRFYEHYYVAANAMVVIVGDLNREQAAQTAETLLSGLKPGQSPEPLPQVQIAQQGSRQHIDFASKQTHLLSGIPAIHRKDDDYIPLYVGNHILGGASLVSRLFDEVREKRGLAYHASSQLIPMLRDGPFYMGLQTRNDKSREAMAVMQQTLQKFIKQGPTDAELEAAKKNITGGFVLRYDTNGKLSNYVAMIGFYQMPLDYLDTFPQRVQAVSKKAIIDAFKRRIVPSRLQTVTVGPGEKK